MKIKIKMHPNSSQEKIERVSETEFEIWMKEKPVDNKANIELIRILKKYFKKKVEIKSGFTSRNKIVEVL
jgi:uncharacterized protein (TIGR00251 family)